MPEHIPTCHQPYQGQAKPSLAGVEALCSSTLEGLGDKKAIRRSVTEKNRGNKKSRRRGTGDDTGESDGEADKRSIATGAMPEKFNPGLDALPPQVCLEEGANAR